MAFEEDFGVFFDNDGFGVAFTYTPNVGAPIESIGIFDAAYFAAPGGEVDVESSQPQLHYETAKITAKPVYGEKITVNGNDYVIVGVHPDGTGTTILRLEIADDPC
jgi:hypothetical protein